MLCVSRYQEGIAAFAVRAGFAVVKETEEEYIFRRFLRHQNWVKQATEYSNFANQYWEHRIGFQNALKKTYIP